MTNPAIQLPTTPAQAFAILVQVSRMVTTNADGHDQIQASLAIIQALLPPEPKATP